MGDGSRPCGCDACTDERIDRIAALENASHSFKTYIAFGTPQSVRRAVTRAYEVRP